MTSEDDCPQEFVGGGAPLADKPKKWTKARKRKNKVRVKPDRKKK